MARWDVLGRVGRLLVGYVPMAHTLTLRAYAAWRKERGLAGQSHEAVRRAIKAGRLTDKAVRREGRRYLIDPELADAEWGDNTNPAQVREPDALKQGEQVPAGQAAMFEDVPEGKALGTDGQAADENAPPPLANSSAFLQAYKAKLAQLELAERVGALVRRDRVEAEWLRVGRTLRERFMQLPDRLSAELANESDVGEVRRRLDAEVRAALRVLEEPDAPGTKKAG